MIVRLIALNLPPVAVLAACAHAGLLNRFVNDLWLGVPCAVVAGWVVLCVALLAAGKREAARWEAEWLVFLGLIGTVVGIILALQGVTAGDVADIAGVTDMVAWLITGMGAAFYTTLIGAVGYFWFCRLERWTEQ